MKFENFKNIFTPQITEFELTEKEIEYIIMLISGVDKNKIAKLLIITKTEIENIYNKLGLTDKTKIRSVQLATLMAINKLITKDIFLNVYEKYNCIECKNFIELIKSKKE